MRFTKAAFLFILGSAVLGMASHAQALTSPGTVADISKWGTTATQLSATAANSSDPNNPNPIGTVYFFAASVQSQIQYANRALTSDGTGKSIILEASFTDPSSSPKAFDIIDGSLIGPLLAQTSYYVYAQACPPSPDPNNPTVVPNTDGCTAWTELNPSPLMTSTYPTGLFTPIMGPSGASVSGVDAPYSTFTAVVSYSLLPPPDFSNISAWKMQLTNVSLKSTSPVLSFPKSQNSETISNANWNGAWNNFLPAQVYQVTEWLAFPYGQVASSQTFKFYTHSSRPYVNPANGDGILAVYSTSATFQFENSSPTTAANPKGTGFDVYCVTCHQNKTCQQSVSSLLSSKLGVSTETFVTSVSGLTPGESYSCWAFAQDIVNNIAYAAFPPLLMPGTDPYMPWTDPIFQPITQSEVGIASFTAHTKLSSTQGQSFSYWHMVIQSQVDPTNTSGELKFPYQNPLTVTHKDWTGLMPNASYVVTEWLEYSTGTTTSKTTPPVFYTMPSPAGILPGDGPVNTSEHGVTLQWHNSNDPILPDPIKTLYTINIELVSNGKLMPTSVGGYFYAPTAVSSDMYTITIDNGLLQTNTVYQALITVTSKGQGMGWPGVLSKPLGAPFITSSALKTIAVTDIHISSAQVTLTDAQQAFIADHYVSSYTTMSGLTVVRGPWVKGATQASFWAINLIPNYTYGPANLTAEVCTSTDDSLCTPLVGTTFTTQPANLVADTMTYPPFGLTATSTSMSAHWLDPYNPGNTQYQVTLCSGPAFAVCTTTTSLKVSGNAQLHLFSHLIEGDTYQISVQALGMTIAGTPLNGNVLTFPPLRTPPSSQLTLLSAHFDNGGYALDETTVSVPSNAHLILTFNRDLDPTSIAGALQIFHHAYLQNGSPQLLKNYTFSYSPNGYVLTIIPPLGAWLDGDPIQVNLTTALHDTYPTSLVAPYTISFVSFANPTLAHTITSFIDGLSTASIQVSANALDNQSCLLLRTQFLDPAAPLVGKNLPNPIPASNGLQPASTPLEVANIKNANQISTDPFAQPVILNIPFSVPSSSFTYWTLAYLDPQTSTLQSVAGSTLTSNGFISGTIRQPGIYVVAQVQPPATPFAILNAQFDTGGYPLDTTQVCVPSSAHLLVSLNRDIDPSSLLNAIQIWDHAYLFNGSPHSLSGWTYTYSNQNNTYLLTINPPSTGWAFNVPVQIVLAPTIHDLFNVSLGKPYSISFVPFDSPAQTQNESSFVDAQAQSQLQIPPNAFSNESCVILRTRFVAPANAIAADISRASNASLLQGLRNTAQEIVRIDHGQLSQAAFTEPFVLHLPVPPGSPSIASLDSSAIPTQWILAYLDPQSFTLIPVPNSAQDASSVYATISQPGVYMVAQSFQSTDISNAYAYPVPYKSTMNIPGITFANLGAGSKIRIYTPSGLPIQDITVPLGQTQYIWDLHNQVGHKVASGVYLYVIESPSGKREGKLIIIE